MTDLNNHLNKLSDALKKVSKPAIHGHVTNVVGNVLRAALPHAAIGNFCEIKHPNGELQATGEVIAIDHLGATLLPFGDLAGVTLQHQVVVVEKGNTIEVGEALLGSVLDGAGRVLKKSDLMNQSYSMESFAIMRSAPNPLTRKQIVQSIETSIRAVDGFLTLGEGQRMGIFAAAGMGKTSLLGMFLRGSQIDVCVIALIGERGREVNEFLEIELSPEVRLRTVVVVATSDRPAIERRRAAYVATTIAEYFRSQGHRVLLMMDSLTRFARAAREIGLAAGEPPARRGYPPSVFAALPQLLERTGNDKEGSITAIYTVLVEGDDLNEPVADEVRSLLDGHIVLSKDLATKGHFPAIDLLGSVSRVMHRITTSEHQVFSQRIKALLAKYQSIELLVSVGEYQRGNDEEGDIALDKINAIRNLLQQSLNEMTPAYETLAAMEELIQ